MANPHASQTTTAGSSVRGVLHLLFGRGRVGKSTQARWMAGRAAEQGRNLTVIDADRNNASLASFLPHALRPEQADDTTMIAFLEEQTERLTETGGTMLIDLGGGDRIFATLAEKQGLFHVLPSLGIEIVAYHFSAAGRDDLETAFMMEQIGLCAPKTIIILNEGLAPTLPNGADPFAECVSSTSVQNIRNRGGRVVKMPAVPLATMTLADGLFISLSAAADGGVPRGDDGNPHPGARPLGLWRRMELRRWLETMERRHVEAGVAEWLP